MYSDRIEGLMNVILADGAIEEKKLAILKRAADDESEYPDEVELVLKGRLAKMNKGGDISSPVQPSGMFSERIDILIDAIVSIGVADAWAIAVLREAADDEGDEPDEVEMILNGRLAKMNKERGVAPSAPVVTAPPAVTPVITPVSAPAPAPAKVVSPTPAQTSPAPASSGSVFSEGLESIIDAALADGVLTDKERRVLHKQAAAEGVDPDVLDVVIEGRLAKMKKSEDWLRPTPPQNLQNEKLGNVVKCPSCGAQVVGGSAVCQECGYAFSNVKANSSAEKLLQKLEELNKRQEEKTENMGLAGMFGGAASVGMNTRAAKMDLISNFPVPNTRADLIEILTMIQHRINSVGPRDGGRLDEDFSYAYWQLFCNCINKAKISFSNDKDFIPFFNQHEEELKKTKGLAGWWRTSSRVKKICVGFGVFYLIFFLIGGLVFCSHSKSFSPSSFEPSGDAQKDLQEMVEYYAHNVSRASSVEEIEAIKDEFAKFLDSKVINNYCKEHPDYKAKFDEYKEVALGQLDKEVIKRTQELKEKVADKTSTEGLDDNKQKEYNSEEADALLDSYEEYVDYYVNSKKAALQGEEEALQYNSENLKKVEEIQEKLSDIWLGFSEEQSKRYDKITEKFSDAL